MPTASWWILWACPRNFLSASTSAAPDFFLQRDGPIKGGAGNVQRPSHVFQWPGKQSFEILILQPERRTTIAPGLEHSLPGPPRHPLEAHQYDQGRARIAIMCVH